MTTTQELPAPLERTPVTTLRDVITFLFRRKRAAGIAFLAAFAPIALYAVFSPSVYRAEAKLLVRPAPEMLDPVRILGDEPRGNSNSLEVINTELEIIKSEELLAAVAAEVEYYSPPPDERRARMAREDAVRSIERQLSIRAQEDTNIISLAFDHKDPELAARVVDTLITLYLAKHLEVHRTEGAYDFLQSEADDLAKRLKTAEDGLRDARNTTGISSVVDQRRALLDRVDDRRRGQDELRSSLSASRAKISSLEELAGGLPDRVVLSESIGGVNSVAQKLREQLNDLRLQEMELSTKFTDETFIVQTLREQIAHAEQLLASEASTGGEITRGANSTRLAIELELLSERALASSIEVQLEHAESQLQEARAELRELNNKAGQVERLERTLEVHEQNYRRYVDNLEQARIEEALEERQISNIGVVQAPQIPAHPTGPKRLFFLLVGSALGLLAAFGSAFTLELLDDSLKSPEQAERAVEVPTLATLPLSNAYDLPGARNAQDGAAASEWTPTAEALSALANLRYRVTRLCEPESPRDDRDAVLDQEEGLAVGAVPGRRHERPR